MVYTSLLSDDPYVVKCVTYEHEVDSVAVRDVKDLETIDEVSNTTFLPNHRTNRAFQMQIALGTNHGAVCWMENTIARCYWIQVQANDSAIYASQDAFNFSDTLTVLDMDAHFDDGDTVTLSVVLTSTEGDTQVKTIFAEYVTILSDCSFHIPLCVCNIHLFQIRSTRRFDDSGGRNRNNDLQ